MSRSSTRAASRATRVVADGVLDHAAGHRRGEDRLAGGGSTHRLDDLCRRCVLEEEAAGPGTQRPEDLRVAVEGGENEDGGRVAQGADPGGGPDPVYARHPQIHQHHVDRVPVQRSRDLGAVGGLPHDDDAVRTVEHHGQPGTHQRVVVDDEDPHRGRGGGYGDQGSQACTRKLPPG